MSYRNGTYVAFDGQGTTDPTQSDLKYLGLLRGWDKNKKFEFHFVDSHLKTCAVRDSSKRSTLESRLMERMRNSKNMLLILSDDTNYNRGMLGFEIEKAVDLYELPIIIAYTDCDRIRRYNEYSERWPKALVERINDESVNAIHIPFTEKAIMDSLQRFSVNSLWQNELKGPYNIYSGQMNEHHSYFF